MGRPRRVECGIGSIAGRVGLHARPLRPVEGRFERRALVRRVVQLAIDAAQTTADRRVFGFVGRFERGIGH